MSFNGKYIRLSAVLDQVMRDNDYDFQVDYYDAAEWAGRAIDLIGASPAYMPKVESLSVVNYRVVLPNDLCHLVGIRDIDNNGVALIESTDVFFLSPEAEEIYEGSQTPKTYKLVDGYLFTNFEEGDLEIAYLGYPVDENNIPMIPDIARYVNAVSAYITFRLDNIMYRKGKLAKGIRDGSEQEWLFYVQSANSSVNTPDVLKLEAMFRNINKIVQDKSAFDYNFKYANVPTINRNH